MSEEDRAEYYLVKGAEARMHPYRFLKDWCETYDNHDIVSPWKPYPDRLYIRVYTRAWKDFVVLFVEKSRQIMITWTTCGLLLWDALFHKARANFIQSKREEDANDVIERARFLYERLQSKGFPGLPAIESTRDKVGKIGEIYIPTTRSFFRAIPQGPDKIRSQVISNLFSDEAAFQPKFSGAYEAAMPAVEGGGRLTAVSTANGKSPHWRMLYGIDPYTGFPAGDDQVDSAKITDIKYTEQQLLEMSDAEFDAIPFEELVACCHGLRFRVTCHGDPVLRIHYTADPERDTRTEQGRIKVIAARGRMRGGKDAWEREMEMNYDSYEGRAVVQNFSRERHLRDYAVYDGEHCIYQGVDYGSTMCGSLLGQYIPIKGYQNIYQLRLIDELILRNSSTEILAKELVERLRAHYSRAWQGRNFKIFPDPAGNQRKETVADKSLNTSIKIFNHYGLPTTTRKFGVPESTDYVKAVFARTLPNGEPAVVISPKCEYIIKCLLGGWRYPDVDDGKNTGHPDKDGEFDHGGDMLRYLICNVFKIRDVEERPTRPLPVPVREMYTGRIIGYRRPELAGGRP